MGTCGKRDPYVGQNAWQNMLMNNVNPLKFTKSATLVIDRIRIGQILQIKKGHNIKVMYLPKGLTWAVP